MFDVKNNDFSNMNNIRSRKYVDLGVFHNYVE